MQNNTISLIRVSDLFGKRFFVPEYQRGYRWTKTQVQDLLSDIFDFARHEWRRGYNGLSKMWHGNRQPKKFL